MTLRPRGHHTQGWMPGTEGYTTWAPWPGNSQGTQRQEVDLGLRGWRGSGEEAEKVLCVVLAPRAECWGTALGRTM